MERWAEFQPEEYLEATRQSFLPSDYAPVIAKRCGLQNGSRILEAGCGTGAFSRYIAQSVEYVQFTGIDSDLQLIEYYNQFPTKGTNTFSGVLGDVTYLPMEDSFFDAVCSHTFLTCISDPESALKEMIRVCRTGGVISAVTTMSWEPEISDDGRYPKEDQGWVRHFKELYQRMYAAYYEQFQGMSMAQGLQPNQIPAFFRKCGLEEVSVLAVGRAFSLSDAALTGEEKRRYIHNFYLGEQKKASYLLAHIRQKKLLEEETIREFTDYLARWKDFWLFHVDDNDIWEWTGSSQLLTTGKKSK